MLGKLDAARRIFVKMYPRARNVDESNTFSSSTTCNPLCMGSKKLMQFFGLETRKLVSATFSLAN